jgi:LemA protein
MIIGIFFAVLVIGIALWYVGTMNRFRRLAVKITESDSGIDVALTKRYDILTKVLDVAKAYAKHEAETLANLVKLRQGGLTMQEKTAATEQMTELAGRISLLAESYPELKSSENYKQLQSAITETEEHLQAARRIYNMNVSSFNQLLATWPASLVGSSKGYKPKPFFEAEEAKKSDVKMDFS